MVQINEIKRNMSALNRKKLKIVLDAKFYTTQLAQSTIDKTVDDMRLRCDDEFQAFSILICSQQTKLNEYYSQKQADGLHLVTLISKPDEKFTGQIFMKNQDLFASDLLIDYLSKENLKFIQTQIEIIVRKYKLRCEEAYMRQLYGHKDD